MSINPPVLVVGNHVTSLNIMRQLGKRGISCYLTHHTSNNISKYSRYCKGFFKSPPFSKEKEMVDFLLKISELEFLRGAILIPTNDDCVEILSKNKTTLEKKYKVPVQEWDLLIKAHDKRNALTIADSIGLPIPKPIYPKNLNDMIANIDKLEFPLVVKPAMGKKYYFAAGTKMHMANNLEEAIYYFNKIASIVGEDNIIVQEYIPGQMSELYNYSSVMGNGKAYGIFTGRKIRQHPRDFGVGTAAKTVHDPELSRIGTELLRACEYEGVGYIEFKKDPRDNQYKLIEINPRLWNFMDLAYVCGVDLPYNLYKFALGDELNESHIKGDVIWIHFWTDIGETLKEVFRGNESIISYFRTLKGKKRFAVASWKDPLPFIMETIILPYLLLTR